MRFCRRKANLDEPSLPDINTEDSRSEEISDIIDRMPTRWAMWTALITGILITFVIALGFIIKYPDTVVGQITITTVKAPVRLVTQNAGRLRLLCKDGQPIQKHEIIAYIESGTNYDDLLWLSHFLDTVDLHSTYQLPDRPLALGDISSLYNTFVLAKQQFDLINTSPLYKNMLTSLKQQIRADENVVDLMTHELHLKKELLQNTSRLLQQDSALLLSNELTVEAFQSRKDEWLSRQDAYVNLQTNRLVKETEIANHKVEIAKINIEAEEAIRQAFLNYGKAYNELVSTLQTWKSHHLITSPIDGQLAYLGFWRENVYVNNGQELFSIIPKQNEVIGEVQLSAEGAGKVKVGQEANVKLVDFPYNEFGKLTGKVRSLSRVTQKLTTTNGTVETYLAVIEFPEGIRSNFGIPLTLNPEAKGQVEIITRSKRLIHRLFDNIKAKQEK